jgi:hypothetical protein
MEQTYGNALRATAVVERPLGARFWLARATSPEDESRAPCRAAQKSPDRLRATRRYDRSDSRVRRALAPPASVTAKTPLLGCCPPVREPTPRSWPATLRHSTRQEGRARDAAQLGEPSVTEHERTTIRPHREPGEHVSAFGVRCRALIQLKASGATGHAHASTLRAVTARRVLRVPHPLGRCAPREERGKRSACRQLSSSRSSWSR